MYKSDRQIVIVLLAHTAVLLIFDLRRVGMGSGWGGGVRVGRGEVWVRAIFVLFYLNFINTIGHIVCMITNGDKNQKEAKIPSGCLF